MEPNEPAITVGYGTDVTIATLTDVSILDDRQIRGLEAELLTAVTNNGEKRLILNFEHVQFMSSAFLGLLVKVHKRVIEAGGTLQLYNLDAKIHKIFEITKLTRVFDIIRSKSTASLCRVDRSNARQALLNDGVQLHEESVKGPLASVGKSEVPGKPCSLDQNSRECRRDGDHSGPAVHDLYDLLSTLHPRHVEIDEIVEARGAARRCHKETHRPADIDSGHDRRLSVHLDILMAQGTDHLLRVRADPSGLPTRGRSHTRPRDAGSCRPALPESRGPRGCGLHRLLVGRVRVGHTGPVCLHHRTRRIIGWRVHEVGAEKDEVPDALFHGDVQHLA